MTLTASVRRRSTANTGTRVPSATDAEAGSVTGPGAGTGPEAGAGSMVAPTSVGATAGTPTDWPSPPSCSGSSVCW